MNTDNVKIINSRLIEYTRLVTIEKEGETYNIEFMLNRHTYDWKITDNNKKLLSTEDLEALFECNEDLLPDVLMDTDTEAWVFEAKELSK